MQIDDAIIKEQGTTFAIAVVKSHILNNNSAANDFRSSLSSVFSGMPIILMAQDPRGTPTYQGRKDIVNFLANINYSSIPWKRYTIS